ncbi:related to glycosyl hydrolase, family 43 [Phialocephala subalpina]|uniref:Related to glycosyl hydrolase, family 43 n=1 Tax=Phialocephala subalpina TaxID=576137 RepID=A0A1L7WKJ6_9HELO|nr:related to glycosyl hydrolase, family 43 [Phialocephala subalpina]
MHRETSWRSPFARTWTLYFSAVRRNTINQLSDAMMHNNAATYSNPIRAVDGSGPFIVYTGGYYYLLTTSWTDVEISRATTLNGLKISTKKVVYSTTTASRCCNVWSPEVHYFSGTWYIYYTAGETTDLNGQQIHVLTGKSSPPNIPRTFLRTTAFGNYLVHSCFGSGSLQSLCIEPLTTPTSIGTAHVISTPASAWEEHGGSVNEAPAALYYGGKTYLTFSARWGYGADVLFCRKLFLLAFCILEGPNMSNSHRTKIGPVLSSANGNYGPGSNGFFTSPDGTQIWNTFNADANSAGACDSTRYTMAEVMTFSSAGVPQFAAPQALGATLAGPSGE